MYPFQNTSLPLRERANNFVSLLTLEEKVSRLEGYASAIPRLGVGAYEYADECLRGAGNGKSTGFPEATALGSTWDPELLGRIGRAVSDEVRANDNERGAEKPQGLSCFSPVLNHMNSPLWGRNMETYGEDQTLIAALTTPFVGNLTWSPGISQPEILTIAKHFAAYGGPEGYGFTFGPFAKRFGFNAVLSERNLREAFLPGYEAAISAGAVGVMASYSAITTANTTGSHRSRLGNLTAVPSAACGALNGDDGVLRHDWGLGDEGYVISDAGAVTFIHSYHHYVETEEEAAIAAISNGLDIELTCCGVAEIYPVLIGAVQTKKLSEDVIDRALYRASYPLFRLGVFDPSGTPDPFAHLTVNNTVESPAHLDLARNASAAAVVLSKLATPTTLPIPPSTVERVCAIGPHANSTNDQMGDYHPNPTFIISLEEGLKGVVEKYGATVEAYPACAHFPNTSITACPSYDTKVLDDVKGCDVVVIAIGLTALSGATNTTNACGCPIGSSVEGECCDRNATTLPGLQEDLVLQVASHADPDATVVVFHTSAGAVDLTAIEESEHVDAILIGSYLSQFAGSAIAGAIFGEFAPAGALPATWYGRNIDFVPPITNYDTANRTYRFFDAPVLYPFGHGLTPFSQPSLTLTTPSSILQSSTFQLHLHVSQFTPPPTSPLQSTLPAIKSQPQAILQLYHRPLNSSLPIALLPRAKLVAFKRASLPRNTTTSFSFTLTPRDISVLREGDYVPEVDLGPHLFIAGFSASVIPPGWAQFAREHQGNTQELLQWLLPRVHALGGDVGVVNVKQ